MIALVYVLPLLAAIFLGIILWRSQNPASLGYLAFSIFGAALVLMVVVDTKWYERIPLVEWGGQRYGIHKQIEDIRQSLVGYETEEFAGKDVEVQELEPKGETKLYSVRLKLKYPAVRDSVLLWQSESLQPPTAFTVDENVVTLKSTHVDPRTWVTEPLMKPIAFVVRYFRRPGF